MTELRGYDNWLHEPYTRARSTPCEDYLRRKIVVGLNDYGLGRWGEIVNSFEEKEWLDPGYGAATYFEVRMNDGGYETVDLNHVQDQLG